MTDYLLAKDACRRFGCSCANRPTSESLETVAAPLSSATLGDGRANGGAAGPAFDSLMGLQLQAESPALNVGSPITDHGDVDFWSTALYVGIPDIGPYEAPR